MTKKVLIVEDDASVCRLMSRVLEGLNLEFLIAKDSSTAIRFLDPERIGFALVDYNLEDGNTGDKIAKRSKELGIPYVVTSDGAYCEPQEIFDMYQPLAYVSKRDIDKIGEIAITFCKQ